MGNPVFEKIKECIENALEECQKKIYESPNSVLSESDLKMMLCYEIGKLLKECEPEYIATTETTHHNDADDKVDSRVDILVLREAMMKECKTHHKGFEYAGPAFALELKYRHKDDPLEEINKDVLKKRLLDYDTWLYVVPLFIVSSDEDFNEKEAKVKGMVDEYLATATEKKEVFYKCLRKNL